MKKLSSENASQFPPSLNLRNRKINRKQTIEPLNDFTKEMTLALPGPNSFEFSDFDDFDFEFFSTDEMTLSDRIMVSL